MNKTVALIAAVNDDRVYAANLARSPDASRCRTHPVHGHASASAAYNAALDATDEDILIFAHQDVYLPAGWLDSVLLQIEQIEATCPDWGVAGVLGVEPSRRIAGRAYSTGIGRVVGRKLDSPRPVRSLDEIVLILNRAAGLRFDPELPGFHLYGTDICQIGLAAGKGCFAIDAFCVHNSRGIRLLPGVFWKGYSYLGKKWETECPLRTPCVTISPRISNKLKQRWYDLRRHVLRGTSPGSRVEDPSRLTWLEPAAAATQTGSVVEVEA